MRKKSNLRQKEHSRRLTLSSGRRASGNLINTISSNYDRIVNLDAQFCRFLLLLEEEEIEEIIRPKEVEPPTRRDRPLPSPEMPPREPVKPATGGLKHKAQVKMKLIAHRYRIAAVVVNRRLWERYLERGAFSENVEASIEGQE